MVDDAGYLVGFTGIASGVPCPHPCGESSPMRVAPIQRLTVAMRSALGGAVGRLPVRFELAILPPVILFWGLGDSRHASLSKGAFIRSSHFGR